MPVKDKLYFVTVGEQEMRDARLNLLMNKTIPVSTDTMLVTWDKLKADAVAFEFHIKYGQAHYSYITKELMMDNPYIRIQDAPHKDKRKYRYWYFAGRKVGAYRIQNEFHNANSDNF